MLEVVLFSRTNCHLCEQAKADLQALQTEIPHTLLEVDIDSDPVVHKKYFDKIPVVEVGPYRLKAPFSRAELRMTLGAARDSHSQKVRLANNPPVTSITGADRFSYWIANHWLAMVMALFILYVGLPFLAPVLMKTGVQTPARIIYTVYSPLCHQLGFRSFFLFGEQLYYPRTIAGISGVKTFGEVTGIDESNSGLLEARQFIGNEQVGYKVALCQRDVAIYTAIVIFGLLYALTGRRIQPLHWIGWLAIAIAPLGLDGFSQLISQLGLPFIRDWLPFRESTPVLRVVTGFLFGFGTAWFGLPYVEESMKETRDALVQKFATQPKK
ncbi:MAG: hypothetical protein DDG60_16505 [Anaerolineae bacterium]|nr:MAG: hypothetical protein DDG60_16505 [Anaerolineae bacterium]